MAENFVNILREIRGNTLAPATDRNCIYGDIKWMYGVIEGYQQITPEERLKLEGIEEEATKNSTDKFLLSRENHTGAISMAHTTDSSSRFAMTIDDRNKLDRVIFDATKNDTDENLRNRATHTGVQSIDTITDSVTNVKMTTDERNKLTKIQANATKNATDAELRDRTTHTGTQSADTITDGITNAAFTNAEKIKLAVLDITKPPAHLHDNETINSLSYGKLINVPASFTPSEHLHHMNEITLGDLDASRIAESSAQQFVSSTEKDRISGSEQVANRGIPNGYAPLDGNGKINPSYLDSLNVIDVFAPVDFEAMLLLSSAKPGDIAYVQSYQDTYMLIALPSDNHLNWKKLNSAAGVVSINGLSGVVSMFTDDIPEGTVNKYFTEDRVTNEVKEFIKAGTNVTVDYNALTNELTISANDTSVDWSEIENKPSPNISVEITGDASGSANTTLTELASGSIKIDNLTLKDIGTAGTYTKVTTNDKGQVTSGDALSHTDIPELDASKITTGTIDAARLPSYVNDVLEFPSLEEFPVEGETGKIYIALNTNKTYRWGGTSYIYITSGAVDSVAGKTGVVLLNKDDVGLDKVDNTSDLDKPVSLAIANALALKADIDNPEFTGIPKAPTADVGTNSTQLATTAFVGAEIADKAYSKTQLNAGQLDSRYYTETEIDAKLSKKANLDLNNKIPLSEIPDSVLGQLEYMGVWNFSSGLPTGAEKGNYWIASVSGNGYEVGDWAVYNGTNFDKVDNTDAVSSVAGRTGNVVLRASDITSGVFNVARIPTLNQNTTGNAATATKLATARTINGVSFDGTANITIADSTKAPLANPALTGVPTSPTAAVGTNTTQIATTAFVNAEIANDAVLLTGNQTVAGVKTFSSSPIVPVPTTDFQSVPLKSTNITVNVGAGQTYTTINQALEYLSGFYPMYKKAGITATINLKAGFVMAEQVLVRGIDLGWITIIGEDAETIITHTALTTAFNSDYPAFGVDKGGTSPTIGQLFRFNVEKVGGNKHGLMTFEAGSSANILPNKGFIGAGTHGIFAYNGSTINAYGANANNAGTHGILAGNGSTINAYGANANNAGTHGIYAVRGSTINAYGANANNAGTHGILAGNGSTINAYGAIIQNQTTGTARVSVAAGGIVIATVINTTDGTVPALSQAVNTLTASGIIYQ